MRKNRERNSSESFQQCTIDGCFIKTAMVDTDQVRGMMVVAEADFGAVREWEISAKKEGTHWNALLKITYDVLHSYAEALLLCDCVKAKNHECLYAYLCENYPHLELGVFSKSTNDEKQKYVLWPSSDLRRLEHSAHTPLHLHYHHKKRS